MKINKNNKDYHENISQLVNRFTMLTLENLFYLSVLNNYEEELNHMHLKNINFKKSIPKDHELYFKYLYFKRKFIRLSKEPNTLYEILTIHGVHYIFLTARGLKFINCSRKYFKPSYMRAIHYTQTAYVAIKYQYLFNSQYPTLSYTLITDYELKAHPIYSTYKAKPDLLIIFNNSKTKNIIVEVELTLKSTYNFNLKLEQLRDFEQEEYDIIYFTNQRSVKNYIIKYNAKCKKNDLFGDFNEVKCYEI